MANNLPVTPGAGANVATDEILGVHFPKSKMVIGNEDVDGGMVSSDNPCPMQIYGSHAYADHTDLHAVKVSDDGEIATTVTERERNNFVHIVQQDIASPTEAYLIAADLSDTTNWPHEDTGRIDVSTIGSLIHIPSVAGAEGTVRLGVITRIDGTDADIAWCACMLYSKSSAADLIRDFNFAPSQLKLGVDGSGNLTHIVSAVRSLNVAAVNTGTPLPNALGTTTIPAVGDAVILLEVTAGIASFILDMMYHAEAA